MTVAAQLRNSIRLRGRSLLAFVLSPEAPLDKWLKDLDDWIAGSPGFFAGRPVLLDVSGLKLDREALAKLLADLKARDVRIIGVEGANAAWLKLCMPPALSRDRQAGMAEILDGATSRTGAGAESSSGGTLLIDGPVRSGRQVVHPGGDVVVTGSVASGAEVIAGGSIHVYGTLRGRAIAGTAGNAGARIFCNALEAEFLGIDGVCRAADENDREHRGKAVHVRLAGDRLKIAPINRSKEGR